MESTSITSTITNKSGILLNSIVKNESKIIGRLLESVWDLIEGFYICDTGSTDNTPQVIADWVKQRDPSLPNVCIITDDGATLAHAIKTCSRHIVDCRGRFVNFGVSRSIALSAAVSHVHRCFNYNNNNNNSLVVSSTGLDEIDGLTPTGTTLTTTATTTATATTTVVATKQWYLLLLDADMQFRLYVDHPSQLLEVLQPDTVYFVLQGDENIVYKNARIMPVVSDREAFKYNGVTHEHLAYSLDDFKSVTLSQNNVFIYDWQDGGCKEDKLERDLSLLLNGFEEEEENRVRYSFYLANTYFTMGKYELAIEWFQKRISYSGWIEEVWQSMYRIGLSLMFLNRKAEAVAFFLMAYEAYPKRVENLYKLVEYYRNLNLLDAAVSFLNLAIKTAEQCTEAEKASFLFAETSKYGFYLKFEQVVLPCLIAHQKYLKENGEKIQDSSSEFNRLDVLRRFCDAMNHIPVKLNQQQQLSSKVSIYHQHADVMLDALGLPCSLDIIPKIAVLDYTDKFWCAKDKLLYHSSSMSMVPYKDESGNQFYLTNTRFVNYYFDKAAINDHAVYPGNKIVTLNRRTVISIPTNDDLGNGDDNSNEIKRPLLMHKQHSLNSWIVHHPESAASLSSSSSEIITTDSGEETRNPYSTFDPDPDLNQWERTSETKPCFYGIEDIRLWYFNGVTPSIEWMGTIVYREKNAGNIGVAYGSDKTLLQQQSQTSVNADSGSMVCGDVIHKHDYVETYIDFLKEPQVPDKNWVFIPSKELHGYKLLAHERFILYHWNPFVVCVLNTQTGHVRFLKIIPANMLPGIFTFLRGSTHGVNVKISQSNPTPENGESGETIEKSDIWFLAHFKRILDERYYYYHVIVVMDAEMSQVLRYTTPFKFEGERVEFALSMLLEPQLNRILIPYSTFDETTKIAVIDMSEIQKRWILI